jgi:hypothetical protein
MKKGKWEEGKSVFVIQYKSLETERWYDMPNKNYDDFEEAAEELPDDADLIRFRIVERRQRQRKVWL